MNSWVFQTVYVYFGQIELAQFTVQIYRLTVRPIAIGHWPSIKTKIFRTEPEMQRTFINWFLPDLQTCFSVSIVRLRQIQSEIRKKKKWQNFKLMPLN